MTRFAFLLALALVPARPLAAAAQQASQSGDDTAGGAVAVEMRGVPPKGKKQPPTVLIFKTEDYVKLQNPTPGEPFRPEILTADQGAKNLGGMFGLLVAGSQVAYHYHVQRESVIIAISGEAVEVIEGTELPFRPGDVFYIPPGKKHTTINRTDADFRYLEFFTFPPVASDFVEVK